MSASSSGAVKAFLETQSTGIVWHRDLAPPDTAMPYGTIAEGISVTPDQSGDFGDSNAQKTATELVQVDVWQPLRKDDGTAGESYTLVPTVTKALHGARLATAPTRVYGCLVDSSVRFVERDSNTVHTAITVRLRRAL